jgi:DNA-binding IclR family transcriptional regulator
VANEAYYVVRTLQALEALAFGPLTVPQLAASLGVHARTARRLMGRLMDEEYVRRLGDGSHRYALTLRVAAVAAQAIERSPLTRHALPYVARLHETTGLAAHLVVPSYRSVLCLVHHINGGPTAREGLHELLPCHCSAGGKALLAWREAWRESVLGTPLERRTARTIVDPDLLRADGEMVRRRGYAREDEEREPGMRALAAPVFAADGEAVAALVVCGLEHAAEEPAAGRLLALAGELTATLGATHG